MLTRFVQPRPALLVRLLSALLLCAFATIAAASEDEPAFVFAYFTGNGADGLHLAWSRDGYRWESLGDGKSYLQPQVGREKLLRDPCMIRGPDGVFHMVWTSGWSENGIGYASSADLLTWSEQRQIPVMAHEPKVRNAWAPEIVYDSKRRAYMIFWASTIPGRFAATDGSSEEGYNHRLYFTTTTDFKSFAPTALLYDPGFSVIDATFLEAGSQRYLVIKDETRQPPRKYLQIARADDLQGPFTGLSSPITPSGLWSEGPTAIRLPDASYVILFDAYIEKRYGAMRSTDLKHWQDVSSSMTFPFAGTAQRIRHGTAIKVPTGVIDNLRR